MRPVWPPGWLSEGSVAGRKLGRAPDLHMPSAAQWRPQQLMQEAGASQAPRGPQGEAVPALHRVRGGRRLPRVSRGLRCRGCGETTHFIESKLLIRK